MRSWGLIILYVVKYHLCLCNSRKNIALCDSYTKVSNYLVLDLRDGELMHGGNFNLFAAMSALEVILHLYFFVSFLEFSEYHIYTFVSFLEFSDYLEDDTNHFFLFFLDTYVKRYRLLGYSLVESA